MTTTTERVALPTGVELDVWLAGDRAAPAIIFLHGFPESHRTWRFQQADLSADHFTIAPDQRGFARSSKPADVSAYGIDHLVADVLALADHYGVERFTLAAHDWGGAVGWATALKHPERVERLIIANAPHPYVFQKSLIEDADQRAASQYITAFRQPATGQRIGAMGIEAFFEKTFGALFAVPEDRAAYLDEWSQPGAIESMLKWYKAAPVIVPPPGATVPLPDWIGRPFPKLAMPCLVVWGMDDKALRPVQLELDELVPDLRIARIVEGGHFVPWERPEAVTAAIRAFLAEPSSRT